MYNLFNSIITSLVYSVASLPILELFRRDLWEYTDTKLGVLTRSPIVLGFIPLCVILPTAITISGSPEAYLSDNVTFLYIKLWSVSAGVSSVVFFNYIMPMFKSKHETKIRNYTIATILSVNILEAGIKQLFFHKNPDIIDYINGICGLILACTTYSGILRNSIDVTKTESVIELKDNLRNSYILAYTFWNILFISKVSPEISFLLFFMLSHMVGIVTHFTGYSRWLQSRAITLLMYICLKFGVTPGYRFFPEFFDPALNNLNNPLIGFVHNNYYTYTLTVVVVACTIWNVIDETCKRPISGSSLPSHDV